MKSQIFTFIGMTSLLLTNHAFGQFISPPAITPNTAVMATGGDVGIGIVAPAAKLQILSSTNQLRLANSTTVFSDINSTTAGLIFKPSTGGKIAFGIAAPATGVGFHSNMGVFRISDNASTTRALQVSPNFSANGEVPNGAAILTPLTASGEGLSLLTCGSGTNGVKLGAYAYRNGSSVGWKSVWETQNSTNADPNLLLLKSGGNIGAGTSTPRAKLDVIGNIRIGTEGATETTIDPNTALTIYASNTQKALKVKTSNNALKVFSIENINFPNLSPFTVFGDGKTWIGATTQTTIHNDAMLTVNGKIVAKSCYITLSNWADYVFAPDYKLPDLYDVEKYYLANKHLPEIPSEKEVIENGIDVAEMNKLLLKKIEEITILMVKQQKEIDLLKTNFK